MSKIQTFINNFERISVIKLNLYTTLNSQNDIDTINSIIGFGAEKWLNNFIKSSIYFLETENKKVSDFRGISDFIDYYNRLTAKFKIDFGAIATVPIDWISTYQILYDAFIESTTQTVSNKLSTTNKISINSEYRLFVKNPKSDADRKISGLIRFSNNENNILTNSTIENLPNPWINPNTNRSVNRNGIVNYDTIDSNQVDHNTILNKVITGLQDIITYNWGLPIELQYIPNNPTLTNTNNSKPTINESSNSSGYRSKFNSNGVKVSLHKKSGPGELIGEVEQLVSNGYVNFAGIQFDTPGDYVISIISDSDRIENSEVNIKVLPDDDIISQDKSRGGDQNPGDINGTRPIIAQIDKPTIKLKPIEFDVLPSNNDNQEIAGALGFTPFFWYGGVQIDQRYIKSLNLYYEDLVPAVSIVFIDSMGVMKKDGFPLDDTKFEIFLNSGSKNLKSIHLRFKLKNFQENKSKTYTIVGTLDLKDFYKIRFQSYKGTSFESLRKISSELQLGFNSNIVNTSDSMNWVNNGKLFKTFISDIISHSYISDTSFVIGYIDFYYCFNYVDIEKEWQRDIKNDVGINSRGINHLNSPDEKEKVEPLQLTNDISNNSSVFFFNRYKVNNNSTQTSITTGHFTVSKVYDSLSKQFLIFDVDSQTSDGSKSIILKGAPADSESIKDNYRTRYSGKIDIENVHKQYYYSQVQNKVNFDNMSRISVDLELPIANFNLYKFMKIQLNFINMKTTVTNDEISQARLTGEWMIIDISYTWIKGNLTQKVTAVRKELSKTEEELKSDSNTTSTVNETNTQNNENPIVPGQSQPLVSTSIPSNSAYRVGQIYLVQNNSGKIFKLTITEILENGKDVKATIKSI